MSKFKPDYESLLFSIKSIDMHTDNIEIPETVTIGNRVLKLSSLCKDLSSKKSLTYNEYAFYSRVMALLTKEIKSYTARISNRGNISRLREDFPFYAGLKKAKEVIYYYLWRLGPTTYDSKLRKHWLSLKRKKQRIHKRLTKFIP
ncbi:MAG: hypothetical protein ACP6IS_00075 [Candidatus Asgardarchaeia archaeon]